MKLFRLTPVLRALFPYECEIPAGPSMYSGSGGHSRTGSPPVVQFVGFLGRIRFTPHDEKDLPMDDIQLFRKIKLRLNHLQLPNTVLTHRCVNTMRHYFLLTNPSTGGKIQFIFYWNWMMTVFSLHISATLHLTILGTWSNNIKSAQYVICVMIVRELLSGVPDFFDRNKILSGYDLSHYQVPHCIRVFFYFVWFVFIHHNFQFYFKLCAYCNILDINLS